MYKKTRLWRFTNFDLMFDYEKVLNNSTAIYIAYGEEICPKTKKPHHQGFIYFSGARGSIKGVAKLLGKCNVGMCDGNLDQNDDYCSKENDLIEFGERPKQGFRNDLEEVKSKILEHKLSVDEICIENPNIYHQYGRTLNKLEDIALRKKFRNWMTEGVWIYGPTGTGKSHKAYEGFNPVTHYNYPDDNGWWDGYTGQEIVIINEFRGEIKYRELLTLCDKYPMSVRRRGREPVPFLAKKIIITSALSPKNLFCNLAEHDALEQLLRRFDVIKMEQKWSEGNTEPQT
jgi:hypothetical protein